MALRASTPRILGANLVVVVLCVGAVFGLGADGRAVSEAVEEHLRIRVEAIQDGTPGAASVGEEPILARDGVVRYYQRTAFEPVWARSAGPTVLADSLRAVLRDADREGLRPTDYHVAEIDSLLRHNEGWTRERLQSAIRGDTRQTVVLSKKVPVHLLYWTAWAEADGPVQFRRDVYDRNAGVRSALNAPPHSPTGGSATN